MAAVGFEMYTRLLAEAVDTLRGRRAAPEPSPVRLDLPGSAFLPDDYVGDSGGKLEAYRRFARIRSEADAEALRADLRDRYGPIPHPVEGLFTAVRVRLAAEAAGVPEVRAEERQVTLKWVRLPDRREVSVALQVAGLRPETASNQVRIPVAPGRDPVEVAMLALAALLLEPAAGLAAAQHPGLDRLALSLEPDRSQRHEVECDIRRKVLARRRADDDLARARRRSSGAMRGWSCRRWSRSSVGPRHRRCRRRRIRC